MKKKTKKQRIERALATLNNHQRIKLIMKLVGWLLVHKLQVFRSSISHYIANPTRSHLPQAHYLGQGKTSMVYPERRRYKIRLLWYNLHFWFSIEYPREPTNRLLL